MDADAVRADVAEMMTSTDQAWRVAARGGAWRRVISVAESLSGAWGRVRSPMAARVPRMCRSALDDLSGTFKNEIGAIFAAVVQDAKSSGLCSVNLLNDDGCRSGTQGRRLDEVGGSTTRGCGGNCDGGSV